MMTEAVHRHGALAAIELVHNGTVVFNLYSREVPIGPHRISSTSYYPLQARAMDRADIRDYRRWHREAALRAKKAGLRHRLCLCRPRPLLPMHFLQKRRNQRIDEYGGCLENRVRLFREVIEDTKDAVGDTCGVAVRFAVDEMMGADGIAIGWRGARCRRHAGGAARSLGRQSVDLEHTIPRPRASPRKASRSRSSPS